MLLVATSALLGGYLASVLMVSCSIAKASVWEVTRVNVYFIAVLLMVTYIPASGLFLVDLFYR